VFSRRTLDADARAFGALMRHLAAADARDHTVLMVQVENEIGMLPIARERGAPANREFADERQHVDFFAEVKAKLDAALR